MLSLLRLVMTLALTALNFALILAPFYVLVLPFLMHDGEKVKTSIYILAAATLLLMAVYLFLDMLFGFSVRKYRKQAVPVKKTDDLYQVFGEVKRAFRISGARLFYVSSDEVNAYAVSVFFRQYVFVTTGLINSLRFRFGETQEYRLAIKGILAHEMSHLANGDSIAPHLINSNLYALGLVDGFLARVYAVLARLFSIVPVVGFLVASVLWTVFIAVRKLVSSLMRFIIFPIHNLAAKGMARAAEYRCDSDAAELVGSAMPMALSALPDGACDSVFSTHPSMKKRIENLRGYQYPTNDVAVTIGRRFSFEKFFIDAFMLGFFSLTVLAVTLYLKGYRWMI